MPKDSASNLAKQVLNSSSRAKELPDTQDLVNQQFLGVGDPSVPNPSAPPQQFLGQVLDKTPLGGDQVQAEGITPTDSPIDYIAGGLGSKLGSAMARDAGAVVGNEVGAVGKSLNKVSFVNYSDAPDKLLKSSPQHVNRDTLENLGVKNIEHDYNHRLTGVDDVTYAVKNNKIIGHLGVDPEGSVKSIYVDPEHQGQGVAQSLYENYFKNNGALSSDDPSAMESSAKKLWQKLQAKYPENITKDKSGWHFEPSEASEQPLDMSEAARLQRAKDMGFDTDKTYYTGVKKPLEAYDPEGNYEGITAFATKRPGTASAYAAGKWNPETMEYEPQGENVMPVYLKAQNTFDHTNPKHFSKLKKSLTELEGKEDAEHYLEHLKNAHAEGESWKALENSTILDAIKNAGFDSMHVREAGGKNIAIFDPSQIRSKFAAFDPSESGSGNLSAGIAGATGLGVASLGSKNANAQEPAYTPRQSPIVHASPDAIEAKARALGVSPNQIQGYRNSAVPQTEGHVIQAYAEGGQVDHNDPGPALPLIKQGSAPKDLGNTQNLANRMFADSLIGDQRTQDAIVPTDSPIDYVAGGLGARLGGAMARDAGAVVGNDVGALNPRIYSTGQAGHVNYAGAIDRIKSNLGVSPEASHADLLKAVNKALGNKSINHQDLAMVMQHVNTPKRYAEGGPVDLGNTQSMANSMFAKGLADSIVGSDDGSGQESSDPGLRFDRPAQVSDSPIDYVAGGLGSKLGGALAKDAGAVVGNEVGAVGKNVKPKKLDMSETARMKRARDIGFNPDETLYHGTLNNIKAFDPARSGEASGVIPEGSEGFTFLTNKPEVANAYVDLAHENRAELPQFPEFWEPYREEQRAKLEKRLGHTIDDRTLDDHLERLERDAPWISEEWAEKNKPPIDNHGTIYPVHVKPGKQLLIKPKKGESVQETLERGFELANKEGHDSVRFKNIADSPGFSLKSDVVAVRNPKHIRSKFSSFDPSKKGFGNLSYALGGQVQRFADGGEAIPVATDPSQLDAPAPQAAPVQASQTPQFPQVTKVYDLRSGKLGVIPNEQVDDAISSGDYSFGKGQQIPVFHPEDGTLGVIPAEQAPDAFKQGFKYASPQDQHEYQMQQQFGEGVGNMAASAGLGLGNTLSFGGLNQALGDTGLVSQEALKQIPERNPISHFAGELGAFAVPGLGEAGEAAGAGIKGVSALGHGVERGVAGMLPEAKTLAGRVVNSAVSKGIGSGVEGLAYGAGNAVSESALGDPNYNAQAAMSQIGLSGLLGGGLGGVLGVGAVAIPEAVKAASEASNKLKNMLPESISEAAGNAYDKTASFVSGKDINDIKTARLNRANLHLGPEDIEKVSKDLSSSIQEQYDSINKANKEAFKDIRPEETINLVDPSKNETAVKAYADIKDHIANTIKDLRAEPEIYPARYAKKLEGFANSLPDDLNNPSDIFKAINEFKQNVDTNIKYGKIPSPADEDAQIVVKNLRAKLKNTLENPEFFGEAASRQAAFNNTNTDLLASQRTLQKNFMSKYTTKTGAVKYKTDPVKVNTYLNQIDDLRGAAKTEALNNYRNSVDAHLKQIKQSYGNVPDRNFDPSTLEGLSAKTEALQEDFTNKANIKKAHDRLNTNVDNGSGWVSLALSHMFGPVGAAVVAVKDAFLNPGLTIQRLAKFEKFVNSTTQNISKGAKDLFKTSDAIGTHAAGFVGAKEAKTNDTKGFEERQNEILEHSGNPQLLMQKLEKSTDTLAQHAPNNAQALQTQTVNALTFLKSKLPEAAPLSPLGSKIPPTKSDINKFNRYYDAVQNPLGLYGQMKAGVLTPEAVEAVRVVHPDIYNAMQTEIMEHLTDLNGKSVPYKLKGQLALFLGQDLDLSMHSMAIASNQVVQAGAAQEKANKDAQLVNPTVGGLSKINIAQRSLTPTQANAQRGSKS